MDHDRKAEPILVVLPVLSDAWAQGELSEGQVWTWGNRKADGQELSMWTGNERSIIFVFRVCIFL